MARGVVPLPLTELSLERVLGVDLAGPAAKASPPGIQESRRAAEVLSAGTSLRRRARELQGAAIWARASASPPLSPAISPPRVAGTADRDPRCARARGRRRP